MMIIRTYILQLIPRTKSFTTQRLACFCFFAPMPPYFGDTLLYIIIWHYMRDIIHRPYDTLRILGPGQTQFPSTLTRDGLTHSAIRSACRE